MCKYNPKIDLVFRKLFGSEENKDILLSFINAVLENETQITSLSIKNPYNFASYVKSKTSILDIKAEDEKGVLYDIEMQIGELGMYGKRALYYLSKLYADQIESGEQYGVLRKTIGIHLLDFPYFHDDRYVRRIVLKDSETNETYKELDYQELYFIEMQKLKKEHNQILSLLERWVTFLNKAHEFNVNTLPEELKKDASIVKAFEKLEIMYFDKEEREIYEAERKKRMDEIEQIRTAIEKGLRQGLEQGKIEGKVEGRIEGIIEGIIEGKIEGKMEVARIALKNGAEIDFVTKITGLSQKEIEKIKTEI